MADWPGHTGSTTEDAVSRLEALDDELASRLVFRVGGHPIAHDPERVGELIRDPAMYRVPNAPGVLAGLLNSRGRVVPVYDLRQLLPATGGGTAAAGAIEWALVFQDDGGASEVDDCVGLVIDDMPLRLRLAPADETRAARLPELFRAWCRRVHEREGVFYGELDMIGMMESIRTSAGSTGQEQQARAVPERARRSPDDDTAANMPAAGAGAPPRASGWPDELDGDWGEDEP